MRQLFLDMDGVLADMDSGYEALTEFGPASSPITSTGKLVRRTPNFYRDLPPMPDLDELWSHAQRHAPIVLTGVPASVPEAPENKRAWVRKHLGTDVLVICTASKFKSKHMQPGDVIARRLGRATSIFGSSVVVIG